MGESNYISEPLLFYGIAKRKVWGGSEIAGWFEPAGVVGDPLVSDSEGGIGEVWGLSDYEGEETRVRGGSLDGVSLRELMTEHARDILGDSRPDPSGRFPLLIKFLDAADKLSIQVHPPDGPLSPTGIGKTEAWCIVRAAPEAGVYFGLKQAGDVARFREAAGTAPCVELLNRIRVERGDFFLVNSGQVHAICGGTLLCEIQQTSDVTFRLYDWDREDHRELHIEAGVPCVEYRPTEATQSKVDWEALAEPSGPSSRVLTQCDYFEIEAIALGEAGATLPESRRARTLSVLEGVGQIEAPDAAFLPRLLKPGDVALLPACLDAVSLRADGAAGLRVLLATAS